MRSHTSSSSNQQRWFLSVPQSHYDSNSIIPIIGWIIILKSPQLDLSKLFNWTSNSKVCICWELIPYQLVSPNRPICLRWIEKWIIHILCFGVDLRLPLEPCDFEFHVGRNAFVSVYLLTFSKLLFLYFARAVVCGWAPRPLPISSSPPIDPPVGTRRVTARRGPKPKSSSSIFLQFARRRRWQRWGRCVVVGGRRNGGLTVTNSFRTHIELTLIMDWGTLTYLRSLFETGARWVCWIYIVFIQTIFRVTVGVSEANNKLISSCLK